MWVRRSRWRAIGGILVADVQKVWVTCVVEDKREQPTESQAHCTHAMLADARMCERGAGCLSTPPRPDMLSLSLSHHAGRAQGTSKISLPSPAPRPRHWPLRSLHVYWWARSPHKDQSFRPRDPERGALGWAASIAGITFSKVLSIVTLYIQYSTALPFRICV